MDVNYILQIENPEHHYAKVRITGQRPQQQDSLQFFLPAWCPGSYMIREYAKHIRHFWATNSLGEVLNFKQVHKGIWEVDWKSSELKGDELSFEVTYEIYCHELSVRNSHIDASHAFIHGPSVFMGILDQKLVKPTLEVKFPASWSKISTGLADISKQRSQFLYQAADYDQLIDSPLEIGCHETDGFRYNDKDHELAFYGTPLYHGHNLKADMKKIVEFVAGSVGGDLPYDKYTFITHFVPDKFGGLEHQNSTALQFCSKKLGHRKDYVKWLSLVAHEYFHTWNVKRIRPRELGPFDYNQEAMTSMLWLAEGLTSFVDELFVYQAGLCTLEEYLDLQKDNLNNYYNTPGRKFHSLEESSFNAWIKLYRPDENSRNSSISYYLKGGIVFWALNVLLHENKSSMNHLIKKLWKHYLERPELGLVRDEVFSMVKELAGEKVLAAFEAMICTTEELDLQSYFERAGFEFEYKNEATAWIGAVTDNQGDRVIVKSVELDGPAFKGGLNAEDEIIAIDGVRILRNDMNELAKILKVERPYHFMIARLNTIQEVIVTPGKRPRFIEKIKIKNEGLAKQVLLGS